VGSVDLRRSDVSSPVWTALYWLRELREAIMMKGFKRSAVVSTLVILPYLMAGQHVPPYIDPGTGSIVIQAVIGGLVAGLVAIGLFWKRVKAFFSRLFSMGRKEEKDEESDT
jgi:membrane associated rhomboid family serine protease